MKNISLTEEEIKAIRRFLFKADRLNIIQCVYVCSYFDEKRYMDIIEITSIINYSKQLLENKEGNYSEGTKYLYNKTLDLIKESNEGRLVFIIDTSYNYSIINLNNLNYLSLKKLLSSTILLEDFDRFERVKEVVGQEFKPYDCTNTIDNLDKIYENTNIKTKKKTIFEVNPK